MEKMIKLPPKVSVILPSLNVAEYIDECIQSVLSQTLQDIEVICIDAGSTDGTLEKLTAYAENSVSAIPVRLIKSEMKSYGYQVNQGIHAALGEYIAVVETDDYILSNMYQVLYTIAIKTNADVVKADYDFFVDNQDGTRRYKRVSLWEQDRSQYHRIIKPADNLYLYANDYNIWKGIYSRKFLIQNDIWLNESKGAAFQDIGFAQQVLACARRVYYTDQSFYQYRMDRETSSVNSVNGLKYSCQEFKRLLEDEQLSKKLVCRTGLFCHMTSSFLGEFHKLLRTTDYNIHSEYIEPYLHWFLEKIQSALQSGQLHPHDIELYWTNLKAIMEDPSQFAERLKLEDAKRKENIEFVLKVTKDREVVVFGTGIRGQRAVAFLIEHKRKLVALCDNNRTLWGKKKYDTVILSPEDCAKKCPESVYLIANKEHAAEMKQQMMNLKIPEENIAEIYC